MLLFDFVMGIVSGSKLWCFGVGLVDEVLVMVCC